MKSLRTVAITFFLLTATAFASDAQSAFARIKTLDGTWSGKTSEGKTVNVINRTISAGSAIMSEIQDEQMISVFHMDGDRLLITHYCATGNQPRMAGTMSPDGKTITFDFVDATNVLASQPGHMQRLVLTMLDDNHHTEEWEFLSKDGSLQHHVLFDLYRTK